MLRSGPTKEEMVESIESLILSLPGVLSVHVEKRPDGQRDLIKVHASDGVPSDRITHAIKSALLIYLDLEINENQIFITETAEQVGAETTRSNTVKSADSSDSVSPGESLASSFRSDHILWQATLKHASSELPAKELAPDTMAQQQLENSQPPGASAVEATSQTARSCDAAATIKFAGYRIDGGLASGVEVLVSVEVDGSRFGGLVPVPSLTAVTLKVFAQAATIAAGKAVGQGSSDPSVRRTRLKMQEIGNVEALGRPHLAVTVSETGDGGKRTAIGFAAIGGDPPRVAAMAAVDAVRRLISR